MGQLRFLAAKLALFAVLAIMANAKPLSETELENQASKTGLNQQDVEALASLAEGLAKFDEYSEQLSPEARGWWSRFRNNYLKPAIPAIVGAVLSRG